jgi:hypothetical protein
VARLKVELPPGWSDVSAEHPEGPPTFVRDAEDTTGALQISLQAEYTGGKVPDPTVDELIEFAEGVATSDQEAEIRGRSSGECRLGTYGTVLAQNVEFSWIQVWVLSNGKDFVLATHFSVDEPSNEEVQEASWTVKNVALDKRAAS